MTDIERLQFDGRAVRTHIDDDTGESTQGWPEVAYEAVRALNHLTYGAVIPAPVAYDVLGNLKGVGNMLPQALTQLAEGLERSLSQFNVYDHKREPAESVAAARTQLEVAARAAAQLGQALEGAQSAINSQGYHTGPEG